MSGPTTQLFARVRGSAAGLLTGTLAIAAHGLAGGALPVGGAAVMLVLLAAFIGGVAAAWVRASDTRILLTLLAGGQLLGHLTLAAVGHDHVMTVTGRSSMLMVAAHIVAVAVGAVLIAACERLCRAMSSALRAWARTPAVLPPIASVRPTPICADQPMHSTRVVAVSISHRGPPCPLFA